MVGLPASLPMKMPWQAVPRPEGDRDRGRVCIRPGRLFVGDLDGASALFLALHSERGVERVRRDDVHRLGARVTRAACRIVKDRERVGRAHVLDADRMLRVRRVGLVHHEQASKGVRSPVRVEHCAGTLRGRVVQVQCSPRRRRRRHGAGWPQLQRGVSGGRRDVHRLADCLPLGPLGPVKQDGSDAADQQPRSCKHRSASALLPLGPVCNWGRLIDRLRARSVHHESTLRCEESALHVLMWGEPSRGSDIAPLEFRTPPVVRAHARSGERSGHEDALAGEQQIRAG